MATCQHGAGWVSRGRNATEPPSSDCTEAGCEPGTNDANWRQLDLPHDFVVEGNFSESADKSHGYELRVAAVEGVTVVCHAPVMRMLWFLV